MFPHPITAAEFSLPPSRVPGLWGGPHCQGRPIGHWATRGQHESRSSVPSAAHLGHGQRTTWRQGWDAAAWFGGAEVRPCGPATTGRASSGRGRGVSGPRREVPAGPARSQTTVMPPMVRQAHHRHGGGERAGPATVDCLTSTARGIRSPGYPTRHRPCSVRREATRVLSAPWVRQEARGGACSGAGVEDALRPGRCRGRGPPRQEITAQVLGGAGGHPLQELVVVQRHRGHRPDTGQRFGDREHRGSRRSPPRGRIGRRRPAERYRYAPRAISAAAGGPDRPPFPGRRPRGADRPM